MKFIWKHDENSINIRPIPESPSETIGYRDESPHPLIHLKDNIELVLKCKINVVHPDLLACLCIVSFYPFLRTTVTFPESISNHFANAVRSLRLYTMIGTASTPAKYAPRKDTSGNYERLVVTNVDHKLKPFNPGNKLAVSYGGGLDSSATIALFPEAYIIHEKRTGFPDNTQNFLKDSVPREELICPLDKPVGDLSACDKTKQTFCIESNNKDLTVETGWTSWISCVSTSVLLATQLELGGIMLGSSMGSTYLRHKNSDTITNSKIIEGNLKTLTDNPRQLYKNTWFHPISEPNQWYTFFSKINFPIFSPIAGFSEVTLVRILHQIYPEWLEQDSITYCIKGENGKNCHKCFKCFRRTVVIGSVLKTSLREISLDCYNTKNNKAQLDEFKGGPSFYWGLLKFINDPRHWLYPFVDKIKKEPGFLEIDKWINQYYNKALLLIPDKFKNVCMSHLQTHMK